MQHALRRTFLTCNDSKMILTAYKIDAHPCPAREHSVCRPARLSWALTPTRRELPMTAPHARHPQILARPACTPSAIRTVLAANADAAVLRRYDDELDAAFEEAREHGDLTPLLETVRRWWFEADAWRDPDAQREFLARVERYQRVGPPPPSERTSWQEIRAKYGL
jgi:hypothetical protein